MDSSHRHTSHPAIVARLRRAAGHLQATVDMIEQGRACVEVAQQLQAVEKAIQSAKKALIQDHIDHCLVDLVGPVDPAQQHALAGFREISRYL